MNFSRVSVLVIPLFLFLACSSPPASFQHWGKADALFLSDARFRGGDCAYSVDLGNQRVLWLFGDTFVGAAPDSRSGSVMIRNSIGIQRGYNPGESEITFFFGTSRKKPSAFFEGTDDKWLWPGPAVNLSGKILLTFSQITPEKGGLGFKTEESAAFLLLNPSESPSKWDFQEVALPPAPDHAKIGLGSLIIENDFLCSFAPNEPGNHDVYLGRWPLEAASSGNLKDPEWFSPEHGWTRDPRQARPIINSVQTEFSVHKENKNQYELISVDGFGGTNIVARHAPNLEGPWSEPRVLFRPGESDQKDIFVYSAKAHPQLQGGDRVMTYCTNHKDFWTLVKRMDLYFPRFLKKP